MTITFTQTKEVGGRLEGFPVSGRITSRFGAVGDAKLADGTVLHTTGHTGVDIACVEGTEVKAPATGKVVDVFSLGIASAQPWIADWKRVFGNSVIIEHAGGYYTLYAHLSAILVREGLSVTAGAAIGKSGNTGLSTGPHLHWGLGGPGNRYIQRDRGILDPLEHLAPAETPARPVPVPSALRWLSYLLPNYVDKRTRWVRSERPAGVAEGYIEHYFEVAVREKVK